MATPYIGEIRMVGFNFAPKGWALCNGQLLPISQNSALFNLIGTTYGGDGVTTFALPDLQGRMPIHQSTSFVMGELAGTETVTITNSTMPIHNHPAAAVSGHGDQSGPTGAVWATASGSINPYSTVAPSVPLGTKTVSSVGGNAPHENMSPFAVINFVISLFGIFPSKT